MKTDGPSLSLADSTFVGVRPFTRVLASAGILFIFYAVIGIPYFSVMSSLVIGGFLLISAVVVQVTGGDQGRPGTGQFLTTWSGRGVCLSVVVLLSAAAGTGEIEPGLFFWIGIIPFSVFGVIWIHSRYSGADNSDLSDGPYHDALVSRGGVGWLIGCVFTGFYVLVYWFPGTLEGLIRTTDPLSQWMRGKSADQWFMYGLFYSLAVLIMGVRAFYKYRHDRYQLFKISSVIFFQLGFAFILPNVLVLFNQPEFYFSYFWPLKWSYLWPGDYGFGWILKDGGRLGTFMVFWGAMMTLIATPVLTYFYGKRWYCSWVCGCGGLAETLGDPFRHLSDYSETSWRIERWLVYGSLGVILIATALIWTNSALEGAVLGRLSDGVARVYGFFIGSIWAGVIGVGFYPLMGSRVWCRFGCPMAAILGILQKYLSRFRITTNGGQCISCGNCSVYCEMGIDVRAYAQRGENIVRASCVGCGICATVCPRGVLRLENGPRADRQNRSPVFESIPVLSDDKR
jgi:ferredoxin-type protein NapH